MTPYRLCFYSIFNNSSIFGNDTIYVVPWSDIKQIDKKKDALQLNTLISVATQNSKVSFHCVFNQNYVFQNMMNLWKSWKAE